MYNGCEILIQSRDFVRGFSSSSAHPVLRGPSLRSSRVPVCARGRWTGPARITFALYQTLGRLSEFSGICSTRFLSLSTLLICLLTFSRSAHADFYIDSHMASNGNGSAAAPWK